MTKTTNFKALPGTRDGMYVVISDRGHRLPEMHTDELAALWLDIGAMFVQAGDGAVSFRYSGEGVSGDVHTR